jgi:chemotaxis protein CheX
MTSTAAECTVSPDDLAAIVVEVFDALVGLPVEPSTGGAEGVALTAVSAVSLSGAYSGTVTLALGDGLLLAAAEAMFMEPAADLSADQVADVAGELANMVGGSAKGMLPGPSTLSLPTVAFGAPAEAHVPGAHPSAEITMICALPDRDAVPLRVTLWSGNSTNGSKTERPS